MGLDINGNTPQIIDYNGDNVLKVTWNDTTIWEQVNNE